MASFGAKYPYFLPVAEESEGALPLHEGEPVRIDRFVNADLTVNLAFGKLFAESMDEFTSGSIAMGTDGLEDENAAILYGAVVAMLGTIPLAGGLAYFKKLMRRKFCHSRGNLSDMALGTPRSP